MKVIYFIILMSTAMFSYSESTINCGDVVVDSVYVQGDRFDGGVHANKMLILLGSGKKPECSDITFAYLENTDDAYNSTLSMAIAAYMAGKTLRVQIEGVASSSLGNAKRIAWVNF